MNRRHATFIFLVALAVRLAYVALVFEGPDSLLQPDSMMYIGLGEALKNNFTTGAPIPDVMIGTLHERTPGYVFFVAAFKTFISDSYLHIVVLQAFIDALICVLIGYLASFFHHRLILLSGLLAALNLNMVIHSSLILGDSVFMLPFVGGLVFSAAYIRSPSLTAAMGAGVLFSASLLVRPVLLYFPPFLILFFAIAAWRHRVRMLQAVSHSLVVALGFVLIIGPIFLRNQHEFGHLAYVSQTGTHALYWIYPQAQEFANGVPRETSVAEMRVQLKAYQDRMGLPSDPDNPFRKSAEKQMVASAALWSMGPYALAKAWIVGMGVNLMSPAIISSPLVRNMKRPSFMETHGDNPVEKIWNYLTVHKMFSFIMWPAVGLTVFARLIAGLGLSQLWIRRKSPSGEGGQGILDPVQTYFLLMVGAYVFAVTGPVVGAKYRLPLEPALDVFLAVGLLWAVDIWRRRRHADAPEA